MCRCEATTRIEAARCVGTGGRDDGTLGGAEIRGIYLGAKVANEGIFVAFHLRGETARSAPAQRNFAVPKNGRVVKRGMKETSVPRAFRIVRKPATGLTSDPRLTKARSSRSKHSKHSKP